MSSRHDLFQRALARCRELLRKYPDDRPLLSISRQLEYLIAVDGGKESDRSRLSEIIIGVLAAREVEPLDEVLAELLHAVSQEASMMRYQTAQGDTT